MSGLSLASHPRLAGAGRHRFGANHVVCALALCALVLRARPCGGFACFASCRSPLLGTRVLLRSHLVRPHATVWAHFVFAWGRALLGLAVGVFACGWLGFVFTRGACSFGCLRACLCALAWGWWGSVVPPPPPCPGLLACVLTLWCGLVGVCAVLRARWADGGQVGAGQSCPAPFTCVGGAVHRPMRGEEGEKGWG